MREAAPAVFPVFRSRLTAAVLARAYVGDGEYSVADLARAAGTDSGTMAREVKRLETAGVVRARMVGRTKLVQADREAPFYQPLRDLVVIVLGPAQVLGEELAGLDDVNAAAIFGSWAARALGEAGPSPVDIDLLVGPIVMTCTMLSGARGLGSAGTSTPSSYPPAGGAPTATRS